MSDSFDKAAVDRLTALANETGISVAGGRIRRTSSRFCLGVEHGDYNGTELFGVGTDRFIWLAYVPSEAPRLRLCSGNYPDQGVVEFHLDEIPPPLSPEFSESWARFPLGVAYILQREGFRLDKGMDVILYGNIPGGGMSRSASLTLNLMLSLLEVNGIEVKDPFKIVDMSQAVETDYIGSPCGQLDQIMILFARAGLGTYYHPRERRVDYVPLGEGPDFRLVSLDTGTVRPGLEKSTYKIRREECEQFLSLLQQKYGLQYLADVKEEALYKEIIAAYSDSHTDLCDRFRYIYSAQQRFFQMLDAWKEGEIVTVGRIFREDGFGLRDDYKISGPELECMCDIARTVPGVFGERMLGGGDKGASGALVAADSVEELKQAVARAYPLSFPELRDKYAVHVLDLVDGITVLPDIRL
jgi:galactokinase